MAFALLSFTALVTAFVTVFVTSPVRGSALCQLQSQTDGELSFKQGNARIIIGYKLEFTTLRCPAYNFCNIQWTKNGKPLNLSESVFLTDKNQILKFKSLSEMDQGKYTCEASNDKKTARQTLLLLVIPDRVESEKPINLQHQGCTNTSANIGGSVTFHCEFYIWYCPFSPGLGRWVKVNKSATNDVLRSQLPLDKLIGGTTFNETHNSLEKLAEKGVQCYYSNCTSVFGFTLEMNNISRDAFGTYELKITSCHVQTKKLLELSYEPPIALPKVQPEDWHKRVTLPFSIVGGLAVISLLVGYRFKTRIKLRWKDFADKRDESKDFDVYLSYDWNSEVDRGFARSLVERLENRGYRVSWEMRILPGGETDEDILEILKTSSRCIIIFSPDYLASHRHLDLTFAMDNANSYKREIIPIIYRDISATVAGEDQGALVQKILDMPCLHFDHLQQSQPLGRAQIIIQSVIQSVIGPKDSEKSLHKELLLRMPPRPRTPHASDVASYRTLIPSEVPRYISSRESIGHYEPSSQSQLPTISAPCSNGGFHSFPESPRIENIPTIPTSSRIYPDISQLCNVELNVF